MMEEEKIANLIIQACIFVGSVFVYYFTNNIVWVVPIMTSAIMFGWTLTWKNPVIR